LTPGFPRENGTAWWSDAFQNSSDPLLQNPIRSSASKLAPAADSEESQHCRGSALTRHGVKKPQREKLSLNLILKLVHTTCSARFFPVNNFLIKCAKCLKTPNDFTCSQIVHRRFSVNNLCTRICCRQREI